MQNNHAGDASNIARCQFDCRIYTKRLGEEKFPNDTHEDTCGGAKTKEPKEYEIVVVPELATGMNTNTYSCDYDQNSDPKESANRALKSDRKSN